MKLQKQINQSVQCAINDNLTNVDTNENLKPSSSNISRKNKLDLKSHSKNNTQQSKFYNQFLFINKKI